VSVVQVNDVLRPQPQLPRVRLAGLDLGLGLLDTGLEVGQALEQVSDERTEGRDDHPGERKDCPQVHGAPQLSVSEPRYCGSALVPSRYPNAGHRVSSHRTAE